MESCEQCGQEYRNPIYVRQGGEEHVFDCFQCAIASMAPDCEHCGATIIGHGVSKDDAIYCCEGCSLAEAAQTEQHVPA